MSSVHLLHSLIEINLTFSDVASCVICAPLSLNKTNSAYYKFVPL